MVELSERGPSWARLPQDWPQFPRRSLREQLADRRAARQPPSPEVLQRSRAETDRAADQLSRQRRHGAVAERRVAEALRAWATSPEQHKEREAHRPPAATGTELPRPGPPLWQRRPLI